jgi:hypothetical protein
MLSHLLAPVTDIANSAADVTVLQWSVGDYHFSSNVPYEL